MWLGISRIRLFCLAWLTSTFSQDDKSWPVDHAVTRSVMIIDQHVPSRSVVQSRLPVLLPACCAFSLLSGVDLLSFLSFVVIYIWTFQSFIQFPAVTICNLNAQRLSKWKNSGFEKLAESEQVLNPTPTTHPTVCCCCCCCCCFVLFLFLFFVVVVVVFVFVVFF